jgi:hypothetical protein
MKPFLGFDHVDVRVVSIAAVEAFYDRLMPELGLLHKRFCYVDADGEWHDASPERPYNTVEYYEERGESGSARFIGFIENTSIRPVPTRIAFRVTRDSLDDWVAKLRTFGAVNVEPSSNLEAYPAVFFEDPCGTRLEICGR